VTVESLGGCSPVKGLAGPAVEGGGDGSEVLAGIAAEVGALREVLPEQAVDASMSSSELMLGDVFSFVPRCQGLCGSAK